MVILLKVRIELAAIRSLESQWETRIDVQCTAAPLLSRALGVGQPQRPGRGPPAADRNNPRQAEEQTTANKSQDRRGPLQTASNSLARRGPRRGGPRAATATATAPQVTCDFHRRLCAGPAVRRRSDGTSTHRTGRLSVRSRSNEPKLGRGLRTGAAIDHRRCAWTLVAIPARRELPTNRGSCGPVDTTWGV